VSIHTRTGASPVPSVPHPPDGVGRRRRRRRRRRSSDLV